MQPDKQFIYFLRLQNKPDGSGGGGVCVEYDGSGAARKWHTRESQAGN
jgi:hypothetical protein